MAIPKFKEIARKMGYDVEIIREVEPGGGELIAKTEADFAAGTAADIILVDSFKIPEYAAAGYLEPLDKYVANWSDWKYFPEPMKRIVSFKGHVYGVMVDTDVRMIWYRKDIFKLAGLPENWQPKTWKDILDAALKLKANADKIKKALGIKEFYPLLIPAGLKWAEATPCQGFYMLLVGADKPPLNRLYDYKHDKWICKSTALWRSFKFYVDVYQKYKVGATPVNEAADPWTAHRQTFSKGIVAMDIGGSWEFYEGWGPTGIAPLPVCLKKCGCVGKCTTPEQKACYLDCEWSVIGIAKMPGYKGGAEGERPYVTVSGGWAIAINAKLAGDKTKLKLAWEFIKILTDRDNEAQYLARYAKVAPRLDVLAVPMYRKDPYIRLIAPFVEFTDFRDALPAYPKVSLIIQKVTEMILRGQIKTADEALDTYCRLLKETVGADKVIEYPVKKE